MKSFFNNQKKSYVSFDDKGIALELSHLLDTSYSKEQLQALFNQYLDEKKCFQFISTLCQNLDNIHDGDLLYQAYKITRHQNVPDHQPYLDVLLRASNLGSFHARHELVLMILTQSLIQIDRTWIVWSLEHLRSALEKYYNLPNDLFNFKNLFRDLLRINTYLQTILGNYDFYIDALSEQTSIEYQELITRLLQQTQPEDFLINLPKPKGYTYDIRLRALLQLHPIYVGDSFEQLMDESVHLTTAEQYHFRQLLSRYNIESIADSEHHTFSKP